MNKIDHKKSLKKIKRFYFILFSFIFIISQLFLNVYTVNYIEELLIEQKLNQNQQMVEMAFELFKHIPRSDVSESIVPLLKDLTAQTHFDSESFVCAIDSNGYIIAHPDSKQVGLFRGNEKIKTASGFRPFVGEAYLVEGIWDNQTFSKTEIVSSRYDEDSKITIAAHQNKALVDQHLFAVRLYFLSFSALILGALFVIGWLLTRSVVGKCVNQIEQHEDELETFNTKLEQSVEKRTAELTKSNRRLQEEVATRRRSEERYRAMYSRTPVMLHSIDPNTSKLLRVSDHWLETLGYDHEEVIGRSVFDFMTETSKQFSDKSVLPEFLKTGFLKNVELQFVKKSGEIIDVLLSSIAERDATGEIVRSVTVSVDVTERKRAESALRKAHDELEIRVQQRTAELSEANSLLASKNEELETFAYSVSHDLRAPLRSIDGFSQALLEDCTDSLNECGRDYLNRVRAASQRMGHLIDDMLNLSRISKREIIREKVDLSVMAKTVARELQEEEPGRKVTFKIPSDIKVNGDAQLLRIVLENLLDNAWKYTGKHARAEIEFGVTELNGEKSYFVRDDGAGFDAKFAGKLFGPFQRLHRNTEFEGNGIGLATVQRIIHRHGGRVWAEGAVEKGATFYFTLPND